MIYDGILNNMPVKVWYESWTWKSPQWNGNRMPWWEPNLRKPQTIANPASGKKRLQNPSKLPTFGNPSVFFSFLFSAITILHDDRIILSSEDMPYGSRHWEATAKSIGIFIHHEMALSSYRWLGLDKTWFPPQRQSATVDVQKTSKKWRNRLEKSSFWLTL